MISGGDYDASIPARRDESADHHIDVEFRYPSVTMLRRLMAAGAALLFLATPIATVVCEASCAEHASMPATGGQHACCPERSDGNGTAIRSVPTLCDHPADVPAGTTPSQDVAAALPPAIADAFVIYRTCARARARGVFPPAADPLALTTQLRI